MDQKEVELEAKRKALETFFGQLADLFKALNKIAPQHSARLEKEGLKIKAAIAAGVQFNKIVVPFHAKVREFYVKYDGFKGQSQERIFEQVLKEGIVLANEHEGSDQGLDKIWAKLNPQTQKHLSGYFFVLVKSAVTLCGPLVVNQHQHQPSAGDAEAKELQQIQHFVARLDADVKSGKLKDVGSILPDNKNMSKLATQLIGDIQNNRVPPHLQPAVQTSWDVINQYRAKEAKRRAESKDPLPEKTGMEAFSEMAGMVIQAEMAKKKQEQSRKAVMD